MRAAKSIARLCASASMTKLTTVPSRLRISTGRRPQVSDQWPSSGDAMSCATENDAKSSPIVERRRAERLRVERQQRNDDPEPDQVDEDRQEDDDERPAHFFSVTFVITTGSTGTSSMPSRAAGLHLADAIDDVHAVDDPAEDGVAEDVRARSPCGRGAGCWTG